MFFPKSLSRALALGLAILLVLAGAPMVSVNASDSNGLIGSVSAVGPVRLRGVELSREGTLFSGDSIRTEDEAYVRLRLIGGQQIELGSGTDVMVEGGDEVVQIAMNSGTLSFFSSASSTPMSINVESYEILASEGAAGNVRFLDPNRVGVRAIGGSLTVRNRENGELVLLQQDDQDQDDDQVIILADPPEITLGGGLSEVALYSIIGGAAGGLLLWLALRESASPSS